jgi:hypothetical protein
MGANTQQKNVTFQKTWSTRPLGETQTLKWTQLVCHDPCGRGLQRWQQITNSRK